MRNFNQPKLSIGDKIGFVTLGRNIDEKDSVVFFEVVEITTRDGETAYRYMYPDFSVSSSAIKESELDNHTIVIKPRKKAVVSSENEDLMKFSDFTIRDATKRLNKFDYYIENIHGTEFEVANATNANAYIVDFRPSTKQASCTCPDFINRARICKHIAFVHSSVVSVA